MKRLISFSLFTALIGLALPVQAQTIATTTTLSANVSNTDTVINVTSATGYVADAFVYVDWEQMRIRSVSGTAITVVRGVNGTATRAHDNTERVILALTDDHFHTNDPDFGQDCVRGSGQAAFLPWINVRSGTIFACQTTTGTTGSTGAWSATNTIPVTNNSVATSF